MNYNVSKSKKKNIILIVSLAIIVLAVAGFIFTQSFSNGKGYRTISVVEVSGNVGVVKDGIEYSAYPGMRLQEGHEIITMGNSYVRLVLDDDKYVKLESGSKLVFETLGLLGSGKTSLKLERGTLTTELVKPLGEDEEYVVNTPNAVLAVRGTFFRVEIDNSNEGEVTANVMTYGGSVASQRVLPTGEVVEEEVLIDAGYKTTINKDVKDTVYVVEEVEGAIDSTGDGKVNLAPIKTEDIPDEDLVDVYFAAENGHELFITVEEAKENIEDREIVIEEQVSIYEKAEAVKKEQEAAENGNTNTNTNTTSSDVVANDSKPLPKEEEKKPVVEEEKPNVSTGVITDGDGKPEEKPHEHGYAESARTEATCITAGSVTYNCTCGHSYTEEIAALGHDYAAEFTVDKEATCTEAGSQSKHCSRCDSTSEVTVIPALGHTEVHGGTADCHSKCDVCGEILSAEHEFTESARTDATCETAGKVTYTCGCGYSYTDVIEALGHDYATEFTVDVEATCTEAGSQSKHCSRCDSTSEVTVIPALGHTEVHGGTADCHSKCDVCGEILSAEHEYTESARTDATCTETGSVTYACGCGHSYSETIEALGHTEVAGGTADCHSKCDICGEILSTEHEYTETARTEATCTTEGFVTYTCGCGHSYTETIEALGHTEVAGGTADCHSKCDICGESLSTEHEYEESARTEATCTTEGSITYTCGCGHSYTEKIESLGHTEVAGGTADCHSKCDICGEILSTEHEYEESARTEATCTETGSVTYTCDCGHSYTETLKALGHTEVAGGTADCHTKCDICGETLSTEHSYIESARTEATCTTEGSVTYTCECGHSYSETIEALGHTEVAGGTADCHSKCDICGETLSIEHSYTETARTEETCTTEGSVTYTCDCGHSYSETIKALGHTEVAGGTEDCHTKCDICGETLSTEHSYIESARTEATCTEEGSVTYGCECGHSYSETIKALGHTEVAGGTADCHSKCDICGETLSTEHSYSETARTEATCTTEGSVTYTCDCGHSYSETIKALGHTEVAGGTEDCHTKCDICGETLSIEHSYSETARTDATCTEEGSVTYTCECGHSYSETIEALGHTEVAGGTADCHTKCDICGETLSTEHSYIESARTDATCTAEGSVTYTCECGHSYSETIEALGHTEVAGGTADCHSKCDICGETLSTEHSYTETARTDATCIETGSVTYDCDCGYSYTEEITATGHKEVFGGEMEIHLKCEVCGEVLGMGHVYTDQVTKEATCTEKGETTHTCECGYSCVSEIPALGHTEVAGGTADCHSKCDICGEILSTEHSYTETARTDATCEDAGSVTYGCECGHSYTETIAATGHDYVAKTDEPTDTANGRTYEECSKCGDVINESTIVALNATNFPDVNFRAYLEAAYNTDGEAGLSATEIAAITSLIQKGDGADGVIVTDGGISDLTGIEYLTELTTLDVSYNANLTALDVSKNTKLTSIVATCTGITTIDISGCTQLQTLELEYCTALTELDITENGYLVELKLNNSGIATFNYGSQTYVTWLDIRGTELTTVVFDYFNNVQILKVDASLTEFDISSCNSITDLYIGAGTGFTTLNITNPSLRNVVFEGTTGITEIEATQAMGLSAIDTSKCPELTALRISGTAITELDLSQNTKLESLLMSDCTSIAILDLSGLSQLSMLNITNCSMLQMLEVDDTAITELDLTGCTMLTSLNVSGCTELTTLDTSALTALQTLTVSGSGLTSLDVSGKNALTTLNAQNCLSLVSVNCEAAEKNSNALTTVDVTGCTNLVNLNLKYCSYVTELDLQTLENLEVLDIAYSGVTTFTGVTGMSFPNNPKLREVYANHLNVSSIDVSSNTELEVFYNTSNTTATTLDLTNNVKLRELALGDLTQVTTLDLSQCTLLEWASIGGTKITTLTLANHPNLTYLELTNSSRLSQLEITNSPNLATLVLSNCTSLTSLDISAFTNLEVFNASASGIKTLSGSTTCLDFSANKKLKDIRLNNLTSFSEINLTENTALEIFVYSAMPMKTIDLSNCVALQNFQIGGSAVTSLDFSNCPEIYRIINQNSSALTTLNVSGCTKLFDVRLAGTNNISTVEVANAGTDVELGSYLEGKYLVFTVSSGSTTATTLQNATGWDDTKMSIAN